MFDEFDADKNGVIDFDEFFSFMCKKKDIYVEDKNKARKAFDQIDKNNDGVLTYEELLDYGMGDEASQRYHLKEQARFERMAKTYEEYSRSFFNKAFNSKEAGAN